MTEKDKYRSWALIHTVSGKMYLTEVHVTNRDQAEELIDHAFIQLHAATTFEFYSQLGATPQGKLQRQVFAVQVDNILEEALGCTRINEAWFFFSLSEEDYNYYVKVIENAENARVQSRAAKVGLDLTGKMPGKM